MRTSDSTLGFALPPPASPTSRQPLMTLPLSRFVSSSIASAGSPRSMAHKRPAPSTPGTPETLDDSGRQVVKKRSWRPVTPREHAILARDDLGVGKSPARRLFGHSDSGSSGSAKSTIDGISGAVPISSAGRCLAPSPPIAESSSMATASAPAVPWSTGASPSPSGRTRLLPPATVEGENGVMFNAHWPGFDVYDDATLSAAYSAPLTPLRSAASRLGKRGSPSIKSRTPSRSASVSATTSPASSDQGTPRGLDNQENIPPASLPTTASSRATPSSKVLSPRSSPIKTVSSVRSTASLSSVGTRHAHGSHDESMDGDEDDSLVADMLGVSAAVVVSSGGGGTCRRRTGKSKLDQVFAGHEPYDDEDDDVGLAQELTPGRVREPLSVAKERMLLEVDDL